MAKIWLGVFWGPTTEPGPEMTPARSERTMMSSTGTAVLATLAIAVFAGPLWTMSQQAAADLVARAPYVLEVLG